MLPHHKPMRLLFPTLVLAAFCWPALAADIPEEPRFDIKHFEVVGNTLLDAGLIDTTLAGHLGMGRRFADIEAARSALQERYTGLGYATVEVAVPEQEISTGTIRMQVGEHSVTQVESLGAKHHDLANLRASVPGLREGRIPNTTLIAESLRLADENPSKRTYLLFKPALEGDEIHAVLRVEDEKTWKTFVSLDDTGSKETGATRLSLGYQNANLFNRDRVLTLQYITSPEKLSKVGIFGIGYHVPLYARSDAIDLSAGHSNVNTGNIQGAFNVTGRGDILGAAYTFNLVKHGALEQKFALGLDYRAYNNAGATESLYTVHPVNLTYKGQWSDRATQAGYSLAAIANLPGGSHGNSADFAATRVGSTADYSLLRLSANLMRTLPADWQVHAGFEGQYTDAPLVPGEQFGLGGHDSVRGFGERLLTGDYGWRLGLEMFTPDQGAKTGLTQASLRLLGFVEGGRADRLQPQPGEASRYLIASTGLGARFGLGKDFSARLDYGYVLGGDSDTPRGSVRWHGSLSYLF